MLGGGVSPLHRVVDELISFSSSTPSSLLSVPTMSTEPPVGHCSESSSKLWMVTKTNAEGAGLHRKLVLSTSSGSRVPESSVSCPLISSSPPWGQVGSPSKSSSWFISPWLPVVPDVPLQRVWLVVTSSGSSVPDIFWSVPVSKRTPPSGQFSSGSKGFVVTRVG